MATSSLIERQQQLLGQLEQVLTRDGRRRAELEARHGEASVEAQREFETRRDELTRQREHAQAERETRLSAATAEARTACEAELAAAAREYQAALDETRHEFQGQRAQASAAHQEQRFEITTLHDSAKQSLKDRLGDVERDTDGVFKSIEERLEQAQGWLKRYRVRLPAKDEAAPPEPPPVLPAETPLPQVLREALDAAEAQLHRLSRLWLPRQVSVWGLLVMFIFYGLLLLAPGIWVLRLEPMPLAIAVAISALLLSVSTFLLMKTMAAGHCLATYEPLRQQLDLAGAAARRWRDIGLRTYRAEREILRAKRRHEMGLIGQTFRQRESEIAQRGHAAMQEIETRHEQRRKEATRRRDLDLRRADNESRRRNDEIEADFGRAWRELHRAHEAATAERTQSHAALSAAAAEQWQQSLKWLSAAADDLQQAATRAFPDWHGAAWDEWRAAKSLPECLRFGQFRLRQEVAEGALEHPAAAHDGNGQQPEGEARIDWTLPALVPFPSSASLLFRSQGAARGEAIDAVQALMLRLLVAIPPGRLRFTIIDPQGLGESFATFMHLVDYDPALVGGRIWTETDQIERQLADLTEEMEIVIQKCLRNEFATLEDYNAAVGQIAQPYRFLVVANFPANFSEAAIRRLNRIALTGGRCGVHLLMTLDGAQPLPRECSIRDIEERCVEVTRVGQEWRWSGAPLPDAPIELDRPPAPAEFTRLVKQIGEQSVGARRVEVDFDVIAPAGDAWWRGDSRRGIDVPLGVSGTRQQFLRLGQGTSQHALVAGRTGSGKSTLLHALVTNLALHYGPDELELYLVDFKKGVEFRTYAAHELPQAAVVAIESDREFGQSVLERLDVELKQRGELFRAAGVQDVAGFRAARPGTRMPRVLLVIDEFQEFFVEDDKVAQDAALLLDRLVRQGRAFGIHVLLGSQTLGGAYSLARSTLGQIAVRIALQCSESDAHLILSEENSAARLLSRPGEAIYNDANGQTDGNQPFQVVWLSDTRRETLLEALRARAREIGFQRPEPRVVFEGHAPAELEKNRQLLAALSGGASTSAESETRVWLGDPVAIRETVALDLSRQSGQNLLLIGRHEPAAVGVAAAALVSLVARHATTGEIPPRALVLDGTPAGAPHAGQFARLAQAVPSCVSVGGPKDAATLLAEAGAEIERRQATGAAGDPPWLVVVFDLQRFRELRRDDDDFSFSRRGEEKPSPAKQLVTIAREGPLVGVHLLAWCDTWNNLQRVFDRAALRDFELRVLFQMSGGDSSNLIDSPAASRLGPHRALLNREDQATLEKFRPYATPSDALLTELARALRARAVAAPSPGVVE